MSLETLPKLKKELINSNSSIPQSEQDSYLQGYKIGINQSFNSFHKLISQFKKYQNNVKLLMKDENKIWKEWVSYYENQPNISKSDYIDKYNEWLFDFLFCNQESGENTFTSLY